MDTHPGGPLAIAGSGLDAVPAVPLDDVVRHLDVLGAYEHYAAPALSDVRLEVAVSKHAVISDLAARPPTGQTSPLSARHIAGVTLAEKSGSSVPEAHTFGISRFSQARFPAIPNPPMRRRVYGEVCTGCQGFFCKLPSDLGSFAVGACCQPVSQASSLVVLRGPATVAVPPVYRLSPTLAHRVPA